MKRGLLFVLSCCLAVTMSAQNIVEEHYTVSGGLLGAANFTKFRITGDGNHSNTDFKRRTGYSAGIWVNFPVSNAFSVEPQVMYSKYLYTTQGLTGTLLERGSVNYVSIPIGLKFHVGNILGITVGPQLDIVTAVNEGTNTVADDDFKSTSISAFGGAELFPHGRITPFARYMHGFSNMDDRSTASDAMEFKNSNIQVGLKVKLFGKKVEADSDGDGIIDKNDKCPSVIGVARYDGCPIPDSDNDGINDEQDKCPNQAGTAKYEGCPIPDTDNDGINDENDKCPTQAGTAKYNGCPVPDTDGDGINDENDKCPTQAGPANRDGCPLTDSDNDGIADEDDKCPTMAGVAAHNGCPEVSPKVTDAISVSARNVTFGSGANKAKLTTASNASLNRIVTLMNENPGLKVKIEAHTDNVGDGDANRTLSQQRADAVKAYLVSKGISEDRISTEGFGEDQPIAENTTATGRKKNARIEIKLDY